MAKHNIILGTASGSIGDVVLSRVNGQQVQRIRVRSIANPKTDGQAAQRMLMAAITRFYSPLTTCLERSFEGLNRSKSYSKYLKVNAQLGKSQLFAVPKDAGLVPVPVKISAGTLPSPVVAFNTTSSHGFKMTVAGNAAAENWGELSQQIISQYGVQNGDQVTIICCIESDNAGEYTIEYNRFYLDITSTGNLPAVGICTLEAFAGYLAIDHPTHKCAACGIIFSRYYNGKWRRSNSSMVLAANIQSAFVGQRAYDNWLPTWQGAEAQVPISDIYLNGATEVGDFDVMSFPNADSGLDEDLVNTKVKMVADVPYLVGVDGDGEEFFLCVNSNRSDFQGQAALDPTTVVGAADLFTAVPDGTPANKKVYISDQTDSPYTDTETWRDRADWLYRHGMSVTQLSHC